MCLVGWKTSQESRTWLDSVTGREAQGTRFGRVYGTRVLKTPSLTRTVVLHMMHDPRSGRDEDIASAARAAPQKPTRSPEEPDVGFCPLYPEHTA